MSGFDVSEVYAVYQLFSIPAILLETQREHRGAHRALETQSKGDVCPGDFHGEWKITGKSPPPRNQEL